MKNFNIAIAVLLVVVGLGAGFFGGMQYQKNQAGTGTARVFNRNGRFGMGGNQNGMAVVGQILSSDSGSITVKERDGSSKIVLIPANATITKNVNGSNTDLTNGQNVAVFGSSNSDGSVTASNVQLNPMIRGASDSAQPRATQ